MVADVITLQPRELTGHGDRAFSFLEVLAGYSNSVEGQNPWIRNIIPRARNVGSGPRMIAKG